LQNISTTQLFKTKTGQFELREVATPEHSFGHDRFQATVGEATFHDDFLNDIEADPVIFALKRDIICHPRKYTRDAFNQAFDYVAPAHEMPDGWQWAKDHFDNLKRLYKSLSPRQARAADQKDRVLGDFRHPKKIDSAITHRHFDPTFKYGAVKITDGDCDFEWTQEWEHKARPSILVRTFPSPNFHAQWFCSEYISRAERHLLQYYFKLRFGVDVASSGNLVTSPCLNKPRRNNLELRKKNGVVEPWEDECIFRVPEGAKVYTKAKLFSLLDVKMRQQVIEVAGTPKVISKPVMPNGVKMDLTANPYVDEFLDSLVSMSSRRKAIAILNYESIVKVGQRYNNMRDVTCKLAYRLFHTDEWCFENVLQIAQNNSSGDQENVKAVATWVFNRVENANWQKNGEKPYDVNVRWRRHREYDGQLQVDYARQTFTPLTTVYHWVKKKLLVSYAGKWMKKDEYEATMIAQEIVQATGNDRPNKYSMSEYVLTTHSKASVVNVVIPYTYPDQSKRPDDEDAALLADFDHMHVEIEPPIPPPKELTPLNGRQLIKMWETL
jgi:hypothetical protein